MQGRILNRVILKILYVILVMWGFAYLPSMHAQRKIDTTGLVQSDCDTVLNKLSPFFAQKGEHFSMRNLDNQVHAKGLENSSLVYTSDDAGYWTHELNDGRLAIGLFKQIDYKGLFLSFRLRRVKWVQCHMRGFWLFFNKNNDLEAIVEFGANSYPRKCWCAS